MRQLVQYDLDQPPSSSIPPASQSLPAGPPQPSTKKRKRNNHNSQRPPSVQHWDDPGSTAVGMVYDDQEGGASIDVGSAEVSYEGEVEYDEGGESGVVDAELEPERETEEEESRPLTHEEIWDDSALVDAWNSAEAEYKAYHGTSKSWKTEPVKKSPLWYNKPYVGPKKPKPRPSHERDGGLEPDTAPLNFDTFVPTHDPSLGASAAPAAPTISPFFVLPPSAATVSRDEAFNNALSSMYWSGYWTAVYHCQSQTSEKNTDHGGPTEHDEIDADEEVQDLVPTQR